MSMPVPAQRVNARRRLKQLRKMADADGSMPTKALQSEYDQLCSEAREMRERRESEQHYSEHPVLAPPDDDFYDRVRNVRMRMRQAEFDNHTELECRAKGRKHSAKDCKCNCHIEININFGTQPDGTGFSHDVPSNLDGYSKGKSLDVMHGNNKNDSVQAA